MKIKKEAYLRSPTALLRPPNVKNTSNVNNQCEPWFITVPSITYIWTHRPQWRRRHKNRKKAKPIPLTFINSGANEDDLWLKLQERPCSRSSTSPYETCSSRQIVTESELMRNSRVKREVFISDQRYHSHDRRGTICETHSDSGLRNPRGTKLLRLIRSQKRLGVRNSANSENTLGTLSSLEVNGSLHLSIWKGLQSDCSIPKRRVTFSNYVSENSATDTRSQISAIIMNDNDTSEASWCQKSYVRLTDDEDNCSMQTDLSCLISSIIFDESKSSFFSLTTANNSDIRRKSKTALNRDLSGSFFYVNSAYSNGSSCNLLGITENFSTDDFKDSKGLKKLQENVCQTNVTIPAFMRSEEIEIEPQYSSTPRTVNFMKENLREKLCESYSIIPAFKKPEKIENEPSYSSTPRKVDFMSKKLMENLSESDSIAPVFKKPEKIENEPSYSSTPRKVDFMSKKLMENLSESDSIAPAFKKPEKIGNEPSYSSTPRKVDFMSKKLMENLSESDSIAPAFKKPEKIENEPSYSSTPRTADFMSKKLMEMLSESDRIAPAFKKPEKIENEPSYSSTPRTVDFMSKKLMEILSESHSIAPAFKKPEKIENEPLYSSTPRKADFMSKKFMENLSESDSSVPAFQKSKKIENEPLYSSTPRKVDFVSKKLMENFSESDNFVPAFEKSEKIANEPTYSSSPRKVDFMSTKLMENLIESDSIAHAFKEPEKIENDSTYSSSPRKVDFMSSKLMENLSESDSIVHAFKEPEKIENEPTYRGTPRKVHFMSKELIENLSESGNIVPAFKKSEKITTEPTYSSTPRKVDFISNELMENLSESNSFVPASEKSKKIANEPRYSSAPRKVDFMSNKLKENLCKSNSIVPAIEVPKQIAIKPTYSSTLRKVDFMNKKLRENLSESKQIVPDIEITEEIKTDPTYSSIECITIKLKDISSSLKEISIESRDETDKEEVYASTPKNHISTDTNDLIVLNLIPSFDPMSQLLTNKDNGILTVSDIFDFLQLPTKPLNAGFILKEFTKDQGEHFGNYGAMNEVSNIGRQKSKEDIKKIEDHVEFLRIDTESCGEYESVFIEMKDFSEEFEDNDILEKSSSLKIRNCHREHCESLVNINRNSEHSELVESSTSRFRNEHAKCSAGGKCCLICGRRNIDNPRYIRPVCRVKGETSSPRLENDPWLNVMKRVGKLNNHQEIIPQEAPETSKKEDPLKNQQLIEESWKNSASNTNESTINEILKDSEKIEMEDKKEESSSAVITEAADPSSSISPIETNDIPPSRADRSTSCCPPELRTATSFGFATFRGPRTQSAKTYFMRESVRTVEGTANRLLCVISESNSLMAVPPFLPKKAPDWFGRQMPTRRWFRR